MSVFQFRNPVKEKLHDKTHDILRPHSPMQSPNRIVGCRRIGWPHPVRSVENRLYAHVHSMPLGPGFGAFWSFKSWEVLGFLWDYVEVRVMRGIEPVSWK